jgi:hypothetical protein
MSKQRRQYEGAVDTRPTHQCGTDRCDACIHQPQPTWFLNRANGREAFWDVEPARPCPHDHPPYCPTCNGFGYVDVAPATDYEPAETGECEACAGTGVAHTAEELERTRRIQAQARLLHAAWPKVIDPPPF